MAKNKRIEKERTGFTERWCVFGIYGKLLPCQVISVVYFVTKINKDMAEIIKNFVLTKWTVYLWAIIALCLGVGGFFCPPTGQIDGSVLTFVGELFCAPLLVSVIDGIHEGRKTMIKKGDLEVTIEDRNE